MLMTEKIAFTIKKHLTTNAQIVAQELIDKYGTMKSVLSAAVCALKNASPEERDNAFADSTKAKTEPPADLHQAIQSVVSIIANADVKLSHDKEVKIINSIREAIGPRSGITSQDEIEAEQIVSAAEADAAKQQRKKV